MIGVSFVNLSRLADALIVSLHAKHLTGVEKSYITYALYTVSIQYSSPFDYSLTDRVRIMEMNVPKTSWLFWILMRFW